MSVQKDGSPGKTQNWLQPSHWLKMRLNFFFPQQYIVYSPNLKTTFIMASEVIKKEVVNI